MFSFNYIAILMEFSEGDEHIRGSEKLLKANELKFAVCETLPMTGLFLSPGSFMSCARKCCAT